MFNTANISTNHLHSGICRDIIMVTNKSSVLVVRKDFIYGNHKNTENKKTPSERNRHYLL